jgi:hypothetical protein
MKYRWGGVEKNKETFLFLTQEMGAKTQNGGRQLLVL